MYFARVLKKLNSDLVQILSHLHPFKDIGPMQRAGCEPAGGLLDVLIDLHININESASELSLQRI